MKRRKLKLGKDVVEFTHVQTRGVLAGAYRGGRLGLSALKTHLVFCLEGDEWVRTGCRQPVDNMADPYSEPDSHNERPTCPTCARRWDACVGLFTDESRKAGA